jgi:hypothetical protein
MLEGSASTVPGCTSRSLSYVTLRTVEGDLPSWSCRTLRLNDDA